MGLYERLEMQYAEKQVSEYEFIIKKINEYYKEYSSAFKSSTLIKDVSERILIEGVPAIDYYLHDLITNGTMSDEINSLITEVQNYNSTLKIREKVIDSITGKYSIIPKNLSYLEKIDNLQKLIVLNPTILEDKNTKAILYLLSTEVFESTKYELNNYNDDIIKKMDTGKSKLESIAEVMGEKSIELPMASLMQELKTNYEKTLYSLEKMTKDKIIANDFIVNTNRLRQYISKKVSSGDNVEDVLKEILPEAYGLVKAACEYALSKTPYDVQLMGAIALNEGKAAEMYTGEGKTITAILPAYLNALTGSRVDIFSANDYLAVRDAKSNEKVYNMLGLSVGSVTIDGQSLSDKQREYSKDIVYGSATAFAFDFLNDTNASSKQELNRQDQKGGFVIVDEADQVLINNALNPFQLTDSTKRITNRQLEDNKEVVSYLMQADNLQKLLSKSLYVAKNKYEYECITGDNKKETERMGEKYSLLIGPNDVYITPKGERELFYEVMYDKIFDFSCKAKEYFLNKGSYEENKDYIVRGEHLVLTVNGLEKATKEISEFQKMELEWLTDKRISTLRLYLKNALTAEYLLKRGENYQVIPDENGNNKLYVLQDGRIIPNSKFMKGVHQALEIKEGIEVKIDEASLLDDTLSSISVRALLSKYDKISGMTGTADKLAFREIYKLETVEIPKNKEYLYKKGRIDIKPGVRVDNHLKYYQTKRDKFEAIIKDVEECHKTGQPVLVVTNNEEDAILLHKMLNLPANLLVSTKTLVEEAKIVSEAGKAGAITIGTEMAGRGTDISLGGSRESLKQYALDIEAARLIIRKNIGDNISASESDILEVVEFIKENPNTRYATEARKIVEEKYNKSSQFKKQVDKNIEKYSNEFKEKINSVGGLKYIQMNPFKTTRNDNQGKGRVARQGDNGETVTYACKRDLVRIGVDKDELRYIDEITKSRNNSSSAIIEDIVEKAQSSNEYVYDTQIAMSDGMDFAMSALGMSILNKRSDAMIEDDVTDLFFEAVDYTISSSMKNAVPISKKKNVDSNYYAASRLHLDFDKLNKELEESFGVRISEDEIVNLYTTNDIKGYVSDLVYLKYEETIKGVSQEKQNKKIRSSLVDELNVAYNDFISSSESIKLQQMNDIMALNTNHNRMSNLNGIYDEIMADTYKQCVKNIFKPYVKSEQIENNYFYETEINAEKLPTIEELNKRK